MTPFLLFDAYGTLVELDDFYDRLRRGFAAHSANLSIDIVQQAARQEMHYYIKNSVRARDRESWLTVRRECADILADAVRASGGALPLSTEMVLQVLGDAIVFRPFPETREVLGALHEHGILMGVLSNWDYQLGDIFDAMGLARYFAFILSSSQVGVEKPAPEAFRRGLELAQAARPEVPPSDCYYIGDHYEKDVLPARAAGMTPLWLVRDRRDVASGIVHSTDDPVTRLSSLRDLLNVVL